jgi:NTE family protein
MNHWILTAGQAMHAERIKLRFLMARSSRFGLVFLSALLLACAHSEINKPLEQWTPETDKTSLKRLEGKGFRSENIAVVVGFSGGGTRASTFAYGVLQELADTKLSNMPGSPSMLQELDMISSVSAGSFTAAYYGLYGDKIFTDFEQDFLRKDVEAVLIEKMFNPVNWVKLMSGEYGRSDIAAKYYDKELFKGATMSDFEKEGRPLIFINATDLATGDRFPFSTTTFDVICTDFENYPVSSAVAASTALPIVLSPITVENYAGSCDYQAPAWQLEALKDKQLTYRKLAAQKFEAYMDKEKRPWLHLVDGGISDNLGLRTFQQTLDMFSIPGTKKNGLLRSNAQHIMIISVNSHANHEADWMFERYAPSMFEMLGSMSADQISRHSEDTIQLVKYAFDKWVKEGSTPERPLSFHFVEVSFNKLADEKEREFLNKISTNYNLTDEEVDRLIAAARKVLRESKDFQGFLKTANPITIPAE